MKMQSASAASWPCVCVCLQRCHSEGRVEEAALDAWGRLNGTLIASPSGCGGALLFRCQRLRLVPLGVHCSSSGCLATSNPDAHGSPATNTQLRTDGIGLRGFAATNR